MTSAQRAALRRRVRRTLSMLDAAVKSIGPIVAALWIVWQYTPSLADKRAEASLAYVTRFEDGKSSVGRAQRALTRALWAHADEIDELKHTKATADGLGVVNLSLQSPTSTGFITGPRVSEHPMS